MSNVLIVVDRNNADHNCVADIAAAIKDAGWEILNVDESNWLIDAIVPVVEIPTINAMDGVAYVRSVFTYLAEGKADAA